MLLRIKIEDEPLPTLKRKIVSGGKAVGGAVWGFKGDIAPFGHGALDVEEPTLILYEQNFENIVKRYLKMNINKVQNTQKEVANLIWPKYLTTVAILNRGDTSAKKSPEVNKEILTVINFFLNSKGLGQLLPSFR
jgi:hypothetical protein